MSVASVGKLKHGPLPEPSDRPTSDVVIYDGHCQFCTQSVRRLARWDKRGRMSFLSLHDPEVGERYPDLTHDALMADMHLVTPAGERHRGAAAFRYLTRRLPFLWPFAPLLHLPGTLPLWQWGYRQVAKRRYQLAGKTCDDGACSIHFR